jgi:hypothetical protein
MGMVEGNNLDHLDISLECTNLAAEKVSDFRCTSTFARIKPLPQN